MYSVTVRQHMMIAHSLRGEVFGPAQKMHGATYVVDVELRRETLSGDGIVVDIGRALESLGGVMHELSYNNLDELPQFTGQNTTTEFLCKYVFDAMAKAAGDGSLGPGADGLHGIKVTLGESHCAWAAYEGTL